ncbi:hypothetical protein D9M69_553170 [compost metagenome]
MLLFEGSNERLARRARQVGAPDRAGQHMERGILEQRQRRAIDRAHGQQGHLAQQARAVHLLDEVHAHVARQEGHHRIGRDALDLRQRCRVVGLVGLDVDFAHHLARVVALEAAQLVLARRVVGRNAPRTTAQNL